MRAWAIVSDFDGADGRVVELDAADGRAREVLVHRPPPALRVDGKGLTGGCRAGETLYLCGGAALYRFGPDLRPSGALCSPDFNDIHAVAHVDGRLYVANTGLDAIDVFTRDGIFVGTHGFEMAWLTARRLGGDCPSRADHPRLHRRGWDPAAALDGFERDPLAGYYHIDGLPFGQRRQRDYVHPNHVYVDAGRAWVTSLARRAIIDVATHQTICAVDEPPHDGHVVDEMLWLTRVDGYVERRPLADLAAPPELIDAATIGGIHGWCRGLLVTPELLWVGFTAIHHPPRYQWDRVDPTRTTTGVVCIDRASLRRVARFDLGRPGTAPKVCALMAAP